MEAEYTSIIQSKDAELSIFTKDVTIGYMSAVELAPGQTLKKDDFIATNLPVVNSPTNLITDPSKYVGKKIKIGMKMNTPLTEDMVYDPEELTKDLRKREYNYVRLPLLIEKTDIIDIEIVMPDGTSYVVVSQKALTALDKANNYLFMNMRLTESILMDAAFFESVVWQAELRAVQYVDGVTQDRAIVNYMPNKNVVDFILNNSNVIEEAKSRYKSGRVVRELLEKAWEEYWESELPPGRLGASLPKGSYVESRYGGGGSVVIVNPDANTAGSSDNTSTDEATNQEQPVQNPTGTIEFNEQPISSPSPLEETVIETPPFNEEPVIEFPLEETLETEG